MLPIGLLMKEHRMIEQMIELLNTNLAKIKEARTADIHFVDAAIDFIKTYTDKCHHGKEEDILFSALKKKSISPEHKKIMDELIKEHIFGRETVETLVKAKEKYEAGDTNSLTHIEENISKIVAFYPQHINKEDTHFFLPVMEYFSDKEKEGMLEEFREFDMQIIHGKYRDIVSSLKKKADIK